MITSSVLLITFMHSISLRIITLSNVSISNFSFSMMLVILLIFSCVSADVWLLAFKSDNWLVSCCSSSYSFANSPLNLSSSQALEALRLLLIPFYRSCRSPNGVPQLLQMNISDKAYLPEYFPLFSNSFSDTFLLALRLTSSCCTWFNVLRSIIASWLLVTRYIALSPLFFAFLWVRQSTV